jgi:hypothetical protein
MDNTREAPGVCGALREERRAAAVYVTVGSRLSYGDFATLRASEEGEDDRAQVRSGELGWN